MAKVGDLERVLGNALFALPFIGVGLVALLLSLREIVDGPTGKATGSPWVRVLVGAVFTIAGGTMLVRAFFKGRSPEAAVEVTASPAGAPPTTSTYRAAPNAETALAFYRPILDVAPLPKLKTQPGRALPVMLSFASPREGLGLVAFGTFWTAALTPFLFAVRTTRSTFLALFLVPFFVAGAVLITIGARKILSHLKLPRVEVSSEPVFLGDALDVLVEHRGPIAITSLKVDLACVEEVRYTIGTDTRTEEHEVLRRPVLDEPGERVARGDRWTRRATVMLPDDAPHSFRSKHNALSWKLLVRVVIAGWPDYDESYEIRVLPRVP